MRVNPDQLAGHLRQGLKPLYVVTGDEPLLAIEAGDTIRAAARAAGYIERDVFSVETHFRWNTLLESGQNLSLFGSRRLVDLRIPGGKPGREGGAALETYCARLPEDTLTLVALPKLDRQAQGAKWFKALEAAGVVIQVYPVERAKLPAWIGQRLRAQEQQADAATLQFLCDRVEGNLLAAMQEIRKLALLHPPGPLSQAAVQEAVCDVARFDVFQLADAALAGDGVRSGRILDGLRGEGVDPVLVLWALTREIRVLARLDEAARAGHSTGQTLAELKVWDSRKPLVEKALRRKRGQLDALLLRAGEIDRTIKGLLRGDVWTLLSRLAQDLAG